MKVILINIFDSNMARNILRTQVFGVLRKVPGLRLVILVPSVKKEAYVKEFSADNVIVDALPKAAPSRIESFALFVCHHSIHTHAARQLIEGGWSAEEGRLPLPKYVIARFFFFLGQFRVYRKIARKILPIFFQENFFEETFNRYKPDLIFSPTIYSENDIRLLKLAKKKKIKTVGMIKSWDNLSSKDFLLIPPDGLVVHTELVRDEAVRVGEYPREHILVSGIPQYDVYANPVFPLSREELFQYFKLDLSKKLVLYTAIGAKHFLEEVQFIKRLAELIEKNAFIYPCQLLVRFHPAYKSNDEELSRIPGIVCYRPGQLDKDTRDVLRGSWEFDQKETQLLASTLLYSDVTINCGSTVSIEAAYFNTPIINIEYEHNPQPFWTGVHRYYTREHYKPLVESGGVRLVKSEEEFVSQMNKYLKDKNLDAEGRARIKNEQCYKADGKAGERVAKFILEYIV